ncbi:MAG: hypothetical protein JSV88_10175 [Candidatus Aminicenantes bacterium]|nr:MAG: hypothetical protein JSV88_10175 [Candidatus Aminicenantes bacterium]
MAIFYALGDALVTEDELYEKEAQGSFASFNKMLSKKRGDAALPFSTGLLTSKNIVGFLTSPSGEKTPFKPIGPGKPLTIEIRHVYTGKFPTASFFDKTKDMLITSAMKSIATFNDAPRAINFLEKNVSAKYNYRNPAATEKGTPLVYYTPALTEKNTLLTLEIGFDEFPEELFKIAENVLKQAAGIPIFAFASSYLLGVGTITKILGNLASKLFDKSPVFKTTVPLTFLRPGAPVPQADFRLITEDDVDTAFLNKFKISENGQLVDAKGQPYNGDIPYIVISLDGHQIDEYANFSPTSASAALLEKFFKIKDGQKESLEPLMDSLKLYNDWKFRKKADAFALDLKKLPPDSEEYKKKKEQYNAHVANILDDLLKPK